MRRGPKPTPTKLKLARGSRRVAGRIEPQPEAVEMRCPDHLTGPAQWEWKRMLPKLRRLGLLTDLDRAAFAAYCQSWGDWIEARRAIKDSATVVKAPDGGLMLNPYLKVATTAARQMREFLGLFGMSPSDRTHVSASPPMEPDDEKQRFFRPAS